MDNYDYDVIVVGSGMSGGWAAKEFTEKGFKVLILDRGLPIEHGDYKTENVAKWDMEFRGQHDREEAKREQNFQRTSYLYDDYTKHHFINDRENPYYSEEGRQFDWFRPSMVSGKSLIWGRQSYRWGEIDFKANKKDGYGCDWPIRYKDLEPWYDYVETFAGISGDNNDDVEILPNSKFQPPFVMNIVEREIKNRVESKFPGRNIICARVAHLTKPTEEQMELGRGQCQTRNECGRGCSFGAYFSSINATLPAAERTGNMTLRANALVQEVIYDPQTKKASGVRVTDIKTNENFTLTARVIFMCASSMSTVQILQNSRSETYNTGIGNTSGVLGHYIMDHLKGVEAKGTMPGYLEHYYKGRRPGGIYVPRYRNVNKQDTDFLRGYGFQGGASRSGWNDAIKREGIGADFKNANRQPGAWTFSLGMRGEGLPYFDNHMKLSETKTDKWGFPIAIMSTSWKENEWKIFEDARNTAVEMLEAAGLQNVVGINKPAPVGNSNHEMGGARMGLDPRTSYLNRWNQNHEVSNLFVTDGAAFASGACQNPSLTYMAVTARAADYAISQLKAGIL
ncbi:MAG: GMC family oxidoreductase [Kordiimonadaceae bacterium]|jgi:choline dehydrogenase-like flavoprotein|nr:GMC family oxidoreductase [Kordiimonadaceae bacterium]MBT6033275.1 GMC family oxidoreductase [Kordiimonadaceae bacterium]